jgi:hypothetical protein
MSLPNHHFSTIMVKFCSIVWSLFSKLHFFHHLHQVAAEQTTTFVLEIAVLLACPHVPLTSCLPCLRHQACVPSEPPLHRPWFSDLKQSQSKTAFIFSPKCARFLQPMSSYSGNSLLCNLVPDSTIETFCEFQNILGRNHLRLLPNTKSACHYSKQQFERFEPACNLGCWFWVSCIQMNTAHKIDSNDKFPSTLEDPEV